MDSTAHFKYMQAERLNVMTLTSDTYLTPEMSGSVIIANITSGGFSIYLPEPDSGLNYKIIIKASTSVFTHTLNIISTSDDSTNANLINFVGISTENIDINNSNIAASTNSNFKSLNILQGTGITKLYLGPSNTSNTTSTNTDGTINNLFNSTGDFVELICDGTEWFSHGMTKNRSLYKITGSNFVNTV